ncbi:DUF3577 domain-containing protein [Salmonella enterica]|uniref:DUF3577 domain-containing protein n=1 Tax=Salmonella enterica subsp. enterica serovar Albany TaxID=211968 RepID=A0A607YBW7_SALET|nr:DUF3577 domain-containing protein [Salmonella enterica]EAO6491403.1 DUF3577 domain-containing protein [Salmonella enterica subsp. enterica serovar Albany]EBM9091202.1 DUF3577 domain-containing protein [Salmonella enterica subsp. enterica serovar Infantis]ECQ4393862.1 DUF3577 domain-containing protein [Salmonella enterica subsp. enterica]EEL6410570.1 DUF3577 domain-containing protein [Salmonella enterica subsp. enterica serovar Newport]
MSKETNYFNLHVNGLGYITNVRQVVNGNSRFTCCTLNALSGPTDNADYTRFDVTVAGKDATSLINRCQKSCDEDKKVMIGFVLSGIKTDIFTLTKGDHSGENRVSLKTRLIRVDWIKIDGKIAYKAEKPDSTSTPPAQNQSAQKQYAPDSF